MRQKIIWPTLRALVIALLVLFAGFPIYWMASTALNLDSQLYGAGQNPWLQFANLSDL